MGDSRRFDLFADLIAKGFPDLSIRIADVAAGKGHLKAALYRHGYRSVTAWDRRRQLAKARSGQKYELFDFRYAPRDYRLVVGMHPDEASDHIILYAVRHKVPFAICPCCVKPSAAPFDGPANFTQWFRHLRRLAEIGNMTVEDHHLKMDGKNAVLIGRPRR